MPPVAEAPVAAGLGPWLGGHWGALTPRESTLKLEAEAKRAPSG